MNGNKQVANGGVSSMIKENDESFYKRLKGKTSKFKRFELHSMRLQLFFRLFVIHSYKVCNLFLFFYNVLMA